MIEIFKKIENFEEYEVSNLGNVKSLKTNKILKYRYQKNGYASVSLKQKNYLVHRLVAKTFLQTTNDKIQVNHKNCIKSDNRLENLEWVTKKENTQHALINNCFTRKFGIENHRSKKIKQLSKQGNLIKVWDSISDVHRELKLHIKNIVFCCQNKKNYKTSGGYIWQYFE